MTKEYRKINKSLNQSPLIFGIIKTEQIFAVSAFAFVAMMFNGATGSIPLAIGIFFIQVITYAILTNKGVWKITAWLSPPPEYIQPNTEDDSILDEFDREIKLKKQKRKSKK